MIVASISVISLSEVLRPKEQLNMSLVVWMTIQLYEQSPVERSKISSF